MFLIEDFFFFFKGVAPIQSHERVTGGGGGGGGIGKKILKFSSISSKTRVQTLTNVGETILIGRDGKVVPSGINTCVYMAPPCYAKKLRKTEFLVCGAGYQSPSVNISRSFWRLFGDFLY